MPNRHGSDMPAGEDYDYGFGGMMKDNEVNGNNNSYTTLFRQYDPRIGRWLSLDPAMAKYPHQSPYASYNNNPLYYTDPFGDDPPEDREINKGIKNHEKSNKSAAGTQGKDFILADVSMTKGNTNKPYMAFPEKIAAYVGLKNVDQLYALNPGLYENRHNIGQGQYIKTKADEGKDIPEFIKPTETPETITHGIPGSTMSRLDRVNHYSIEVDLPATEGLGDGLGDWGRFNILKMFEPWGGNTNPQVSNNYGSSSGGPPPASKPIIYAPGYPQIETTATQRVNDYTGIYTTTQYSKDSSVKIGTYVNLNTGKTLYDTTIKGKKTDTVLSPVLLNF